MTPRLGLIDQFINGRTEYDATDIEHLHRVVDALTNWEIFGAGVKDTDSFIVSIGAGLSVDISAGEGIGFHPTYRGVPLRTTDVTNLAGLPASSTGYIFAVIEVNTHTDTITVGTGGAALGATAVPVSALTDDVPLGTLLDFGAGRIVTTSSLASAGATSLPVEALAAALVAGDTGTYLAGNDTRETLLPKFMWGDFDTMTGGLLLYQAVTGPSSVTSVVDMRAELSLGGGADGSGQLDKDVAGSSNVTLSDGESKNGNLRFTGVLTGDIAVIVPTLARAWLVRNDTSGAYTLTVRTPSGTGVAVPQGSSALIAADGTNVVLALHNTDLPPMTKVGVVTLTDASTIATDASLGNTFLTTLMASRALGTPSNPSNGQCARWVFVQGGAGGWDITPSSAFVLAAHIPAITLALAANAVTAMDATYLADYPGGAKWLVTDLSSQLAGYTATSATSTVAIASSGSIALTTQAGLAYTPGARVRATSQADATKWMEGVVTAYSGTTLTFTADLSNGSGTPASWNINLAGQQGEQGNPGLALNWITGGWATSTVYNPQDALAHNSPASSYRCYLGHTSGSTTEPGVGVDWNTYWKVVAEAGATGSAGADGATGASGAAGPTGLTGATGPGYLATSTTSKTVASSGTFTMTTQAGLAYTPGARVRISSAANTANWVEGLVSSYSGTTLVFTADLSNGSGTHTDWNINLAGSDQLATDTLAGVAKLSVAATSPTDPIVVGDNDSRMSNSRTPTAHAASHTNGSDEIAVAISSVFGGGQNGFLSAADKAKLDGVADGAGVADGVGYLSKSVAGAVDVTLDPTTEAPMGSIVLTGALTGNINVIVPSTAHLGLYRNSTTGAFTLTVKTASGTGVAIPQGSQYLLMTDSGGVVAAGGEGVRLITAAGTTNLTLPTPEYAFSVLNIQGTLTGDITLTIASYWGGWILNNTTGGHTITVTTGSGATVAIAAGVMAMCFTPGAGVYGGPAVIGANVQAWSAALDTWSGKTAPSGTVLGTTDSQTLTNKTLLASTNVTEEITSVTDSATPTPTGGSLRNAYDLTALAQAAAFAAPSGSPANFNRLIIRIKDNGTARALTWNSVYAAGGVALPTTTVLSKILTLGFIYNTANSLNKWQCVASSQEA